MHLKILSLKVQYYKEIQDEPGYMQACSEYFQVSRQLTDENRTNAKRAIELRIDLENIKEKQRLIQEENKRLLEKSQRDPLTKLPNRDKLNEYSQNAFDKAFRNGGCLGVEIFDIDCFKQYNDTYGHQAGDKCLKRIAKLLLDLMEHGIFCARYGGDEFIIIYENKTDEEILEIASQLKQNIMALNIKHKNSTVEPIVTISQGIRNSVPTAGNKIWDYFYAADMAMYQIKRGTRNDIQLVHRAN
jgi:diguanylate cyclase (GGDEF)-like protein